MKYTSLLLAVGLTLCSACGKAEVAAKDAIGAAASSAKGALDNLDIDFAALSPEALKEKVGEMTSGLTEKLGSIKDEASAKDIVGKLEPVVAKLKDLKGTLGDIMPDMSSLKTAAENLKSKFEGDSGIMQVLKPLLDKIMAMLQ